MSRKKVFLFDLDDTLFDHQHSRRLGLRCFSSGPNRSDLPGVPRSKFLSVVRWSPTSC